MYMSLCVFYVCLYLYIVCVSVCVHVYTKRVIQFCFLMWVTTPTALVMKEKNQKQSELLLTVCPACFLHISVTSMQ